VSHKCGGVLSLVIFCVLGAITAYEVIIVAQKSTIESTSESQIEFSAPLLNLTTYQDDQDM